MQNKEKIRNDLIKERFDIGPEQRLKQSAKIIENLIDSDFYKKSELIFTFYGMKEEINTEILIKQALLDKKQVALPLVTGKGIMAAYLINDLSELKEDKYGIMSPDPEKATLADPQDIDLVLVPLLGYNFHGYRIGYGEGYYDRYLSKLSSKCIKMGLAFRGFLAEDLPVDYFDYPLDKILTPDGFVKLMDRVETHCHCTEFSPDCKRSFSDLIEEAEQKNFKIITLTDHYDKDIIAGKSYPGTKVGALPREGEWIFDLGEYVDFCFKERAKLAAKNSDTELLIGLEVGYQDYLANGYIEVLPQYPFDLIIGSIHTMYRDDFAVYGDSLYKQGKQKAYDEYLKALIEMTESGLDFDMLGHFDYVIRYSGFEDPKMYYRDHKELFDYLFKLLIEKGICLEVNTRTRYRQIISDGVDWGMTDPEIFQRYYDLGGRMISFATDAHSTGELHCLISETVRALKKIGFKKGTYFKQRKPVFYDLL
ncbi:MAG: 5-formyltetrahydrofolate cyclo-ligase [Clostridiaceae bacterium]|nr:5-formyltetrahydrofolate cyclo-ligase [Clostridiaceae bacterium]